MDQAYTLDISSDVGGLYAPLIGPESCNHMESYHYGTLQLFL